MHQLEEESLRTLASLDPQDNVKTIPEFATIGTVAKEPEPEPEIADDHSL